MYFVSKMISPISIAKENSVFMLGKEDADCKTSTCELKAACFCKKSADACCKMGWKFNPNGSYAWGGWVIPVSSRA